MLREVFDAINDMYKTEPDIVADCYVYLSGLMHDKDKVVRLSAQAGKELEKMNRCGECGEKLEVTTYNEPHPEIEGCPMEEVSETYCPNCDIRRR